MSLAFEAKSVGALGLRALSLSALLTTLIKPLIADVELLSNEFFYKLKLLYQVLQSPIPHRALSLAKFAKQTDFRNYVSEQYACQTNQLVRLILELEFDKLEFQPKNPNIKLTWNFKKKKNTHMELKLSKLEFHVFLGWNSSLLNSSSKISLTN